MNLQVGKNKLILFLQDKVNEKLENESILKKIPPDKIKEVPANIDLSDVIKFPIDYVDFANSLSEISKASKNASKTFKNLVKLLNEMEETNE